LSLVVLLIACACSDSAPHPASSPAATDAPRATLAASPAGTSTSVAAPSPEITQSFPAVATSTVAAPARVVLRGNPARRMVALTFDAGSDAGFTAQILDTLRSEQVRATFSVTGAWAQANPQLLLAIAADGYPIINHSYDHASFTGRSTGTPPLSPADRALELSRTETTVYHLTGRSTLPYFRPPFGDLDAGVQADVARQGYAVVVMWTVDTLGWQGARADAIVQRSLAMAEPGAIYVLHVGSQSQDAAALPRIIDGLRGLGYTFGTISDALAP
jgi:peptidoglycan-N-acetylglucosamine deacetylase